ncbi:MAG: hypothetical protein M1840_000505, partial [Geoglossum simile]
HLETHQAQPHKLTIRLSPTYRLVSVARGEQDYFSPDSIPTAAEGCKSNAMVRCCKDLGVASELWDPRWIRKYLDNYTRETFVEHVVTKKKKKIVLRKDDKVRPPFRETKFNNGAGAFTPPAKGAGAV